MSRPEQAAWDSVRPMLTSMGLDPRRVENVLSPGHPDVDYSLGSIELKVLEAFPARPMTPVAVPHYTGEQAGWLAQRWAAGGLAWLFVRVGREWFLFDGWTALRVYRGLTRLQWLELAVLHYPAPAGGWRSDPGDTLHPWSRQLHDWLAWRTERMMPWSRARARRVRCQEHEEVTAGRLRWSVDALLDAERGLTRHLLDDLLCHWEQ